MMVVHPPFMSAEELERLEEVKNQAPSGLSAKDAVWLLALTQRLITEHKKLDGALTQVLNTSARTMDELGGLRRSKPIKVYKLFGPEGTYESPTPGKLGGYKPGKIYGRLDCPNALRHLAKGKYKKARVFFADEQTAIETGFRPCYYCMRSEYDRWKAGGTPTSPEYPWKLLPDK